MAEQWLLRRFRDEFRLRQEDLASAAGLAQIRISQLERGIEEPTSREMDIIVKALTRFAAAHELENHLLSGD